MLSLSVLGAAAAASSEVSSAWPTCNTAELVYMAVNHAEVVFALCRWDELVDLEPRG